QRMDADDDGEDGAHEETRKQIHSPRAPRARDGNSGKRRTLDDGGNGADACLDSSIEIVGPKPGPHVVVEDLSRPEVRELAFEAVADLDPHLAVVSRDEQKNPVVDALAAEFPGLGHADGILLEGFALEARNHEHSDLGPGPRLQVAKLRFQTLARGGRERAGEIVDAPGEKRNVERFGADADERADE